MKRIRIAAKNFFLIMFLWIMSSEACRAQNFFNSPYSVYGLGILNERTSSLNRGMGGTGIGVQDERNLNHMNPASYTSITFPVSHIYEVGAYLESNRYRTLESSESKFNGGISNINYWFKFKPWLSSTIGLSPFSSVSYDITTQKDLTIAPQAAYRYEGAGNITQLYWGNGIRINKNLAIGVNLSYLFGSITRSETVLSQSDNALQLQNKTFTNKFNLDFGLQYKIHFLRRALIIGAVYDNGLKLKGKSELTLTDINNDTLTTYKGGNTHYRLPQNAAVGISLKSKRSLIASDLKFTDWSGASYSNQDVHFQDTWKFSAGYSYLGNENAENYFGLVGFRTGISYQQYHQNVNGQNLNLWGAAFGLSLPISDGRSSINLTYNYDQIGTLRNDLILHQSHKFVVDIVIRDIWGVKRKFD